MTRGRAGGPDADAPYGQVIISSRSPAGAGPSNRAGHDMRYAEVAVDAPTGHDRTFSYSFPGRIALQEGHLVRVPFGARTLQGVVFELSSVPQVPETRDVLETVGSGPVLTHVQLQLARWISRYYMCSLFEAATPMLPPSWHFRPKMHLSLGANADRETSLTPLQRRIVVYVRGRSGVDQERLIRLMGDRARATVGRLVDRGVLLRSPGPVRPPMVPRMREYVSVADGGRLAAEDWLPGAAARAPRQSALLTALMAPDTTFLLAAARREYGASAVKALLSKGWIECTSVPWERNPLAGEVFAPPASVTLTRQQETIASEVRRALEDLDDVPRAFLVQGVTGSGKTEVYLNVVEHCLNLGKRAIVLVPEIALTHQTIEGFASRFPGRVAVLHSGLSLGERFDQWWKVRRGSYDVVIGSRGAVFAPQPDLGLVVVDEEHEWTYKQHDASPRYLARDVALKLSELTRATVVLGSATPDIASYHRGISGTFRLRTLPQRVLVERDSARPEERTNIPLARVEVVDMRRELREGNRDIFSRPLASAMDECLEAGDQMILFLNRRGTASYMQCRSCGYSLRCRRCDVALTYHRGVDRMVCHYCGYRRVALARCPSCLSHRFGYYGIGTQAVVDEVSERYPDTEVLRWDSDVTRNPKAYVELLRRFRSGEARILVGTQMIAKGLHFPTVSLVGAVSADVGLNIPDYRAGERAFQLLCQVAGRAGRGRVAGRVIIQTYQPDNYAIRAAATQDYEAYYRQEMAFRREAGNPPFSRLIRLLYTHTNSVQCERSAVRLYRILKRQRDEWGLPDIDLLGPTPAYPPRLRGRYRWHVVLRGVEPRLLLDKVAVPPGWVVDIDPVALT